MRKLTALVAVVLAVCGVVTACDPDLSGVRLRIAAGNKGGVYYKFSGSLAAHWAAQLDTPVPEVLQTGGSPDNLRKLLSGEADVAFSAADVAEINSSGANPRQLRALGRIYDDYLHVVVRADSNIGTLTDLRGRRVAVGALGSGVRVIADRVLQVSGLAGSLSLASLELGESIDALNNGSIDAFFWSGGLPTDGITSWPRPPGCGCST